MKRLLFTMLLALVACASWAYDVENDGVYYNILSSSHGSRNTIYYLEVTSGNTPYTGSVAIPRGWTPSRTDKSYVVSSIGDNAFYNCRELTSVTIAEGPTAIGDYTFYGCEKLQSIKIPKSMQSIGKGAFNSCLSMSEVHISSLDAWCKISFAQRQSNPLYNNCNLYLNDNMVVNLVIPYTVTSISDYAFAGCKSISCITFTNSLTSIGRSAFEYCRNLYSITFVNSVDYIGDYAFAACLSLSAITYMSTVVPKTGTSNVFLESNYNNATLAVPMSTLETYQSTSPWSNFGNFWPIEGDSSEARSDVNNDGEVDAVDITRLINIILNKQ